MTKETLFVSRNSQRSSYLPKYSRGNLNNLVNVQDIRKEGVNDEHLEKTLELVKLNYIVEREGGWDIKKEWKDVLSGGEKQRIGIRQ